MNERDQYLVTASELQDAGGGAGDINSLAFNVFSTNYVAAKPMTIKLGHTTQSSFLYDFVTDLTPVYYTYSYNPTEGWNTHVFDTPFYWNGVENLVVEVHYGSAGQGYSNNASVYYSYAIDRALYYYNDYYDASTYPSGTMSSNRANMKFDMTPFASPYPPSPAIAVSPTDGSVDLSPYASLDWTRGDGNPTGYSLYFGTDNPPSNIENNMDVEAATSYTPNSMLSYATTYYWQVIPYNAMGDASDCPVWSFTVENDPTIVNFPYIQDFDGVWSGSPAAPADWTVINADNDGFTWRRGNNNIAPTHSEPFAALGSATNDDYVITPPFDLTGLNARMKWWDRVESASYSNSYKVLLSTTNTQISSFTVELANIVCTNVPWTEHTIDLSAYTGLTVYLAFHQYASASTYYGFGIDDFRVEEIPEQPVLGYSPTEMTLNASLIDTSSDYQNLRVSNDGIGTLNLTASDISLTGTDADQFDYDITALPAALTAGQSVTIPVRFSPTTVGTKSAILRMNYSGTDYDVTLHGSALSENSLNEGFEGESFPPRGWRVIAADAGGDQTWTRVTTDPRTGEACASIRWESNAHNDWLITPRLIITENDHTIFFWARNNGASNHEKFNVKVSTLTNEVIDFTHVLAEQVEPAADAYSLHSYDLSAFIGSLVFVGIQATATNQLRLSIDDVSGPERYFAPLPPAPVTLNAPADNATDLDLDVILSWTASSTAGTPDSFQIYLDTNPDPSTLLATVDGTTPLCPLL